MGENTSNITQLVAGRTEWRPDQGHVGFGWRSIGLAQITAPTSGNHVDPACPPPAGAGSNVIKGQLMGGKAASAVLAAELVAEENIETGKGRVSGWGSVILEGYHTGEAEFSGR